MSNLVWMFINCLIPYLRSGGGISLGFDDSTQSIFIAFSSTGSVHTVNITPRALYGGPEKVVITLCDCLTHNPKAREERDQYEYSTERRDMEERRRLGINGD